MFTLELAVYLDFLLDFESLVVKQRLRSVAVIKTWHGKMSFVVEMQFSLKLIRASLVLIGWVRVEIGGVWIGVFNLAILG